jgi:hypothetical protein
VLEGSGRVAAQGGGKTGVERPQLYQSDGGQRYAGHTYN